MSNKSNKINAIISACLIGINCRYNGSNCKTKYLDIYKKNYNLIPVCPEQLGGLSTPREPAEIKNGDGFDVLNGKAKIFNEKGEDVTEKFIKGAEEVLKICFHCDAKIVFFKDKSPSCGVTKIYNNKKLINGVGVTTAMLLKNDIKVYGVDWMLLKI